MWAPSFVSAHQPFRTCSLVRVIGNSDFSTCHPRPWEISGVLAGPCALPNYSTLHFLTQHSCRHLVKAGLSRLPKAPVTWLIVTKHSDLWEEAWREKWVVETVSCICHHYFCTLWTVEHLPVDMTSRREAGMYVHTRVCSCVHLHIVTPSKASQALVSWQQH